MSVLIKNMDKPENCCGCQLNDYGWCQLIEDDVPVCKEGINKACPLVELPPHGRLIDADELEASDAILVGEDAWNMVHNAPTVVEANT